MNQHRFDNAAIEIADAAYELCQQSMPREDVLDRLKSDEFAKSVYDAVHAAAMVQFGKLVIDFTD